MDLDWILARVHRHILDLRREFSDFSSHAGEGTDLMEKAREARKLLAVFEDQVRRERDKRFAEVKRAREVSEKLYRLSKRSGFAIGRARKARRKTEYDPQQNGIT